MTAGRMFLARTSASAPRRSLRRWVLALLVLATLAPGLSRLQMAALQRIAPWAELCATASALPLPGSNGSGDAAVHLLDVCAACVGAAALAGPPTITTSSVDRLSEAAPLPHAGPRTAAADWIIAPSRGPPAIA